MNNEDKCGIYSITNTVDGKRYIGQTIRSFRQRWDEHIKYLNWRKKYYNKHLQKAWRIHGESMFVFKILEVCTKETMDEAEIFWMYTFRTLNRNYGYNIAMGGSQGYWAAPKKTIKSKAPLCLPKKPKETKDTKKLKVTNDKPNKTNDKTKKAKKPKVVIEYSREYLIELSLGFHQRFKGA